MAKYINADEAIAILKDTNEYEKEHAELISEFISEQPSADVVEVVRCKDCKKFRNNICRKFMICTELTDYCSYGERKETE